ncbi:hypothetical protein NVP1193O_055 [Vibrio phage 1.193.O._10N.286.52.C6]|nr:hypothetical protein NVP1193O_055 [Vibrio phage 1.193.O._10N.286.52.C6]
MCPYNDCGWCYAPEDKSSNDTNGACNTPRQCEQFIPIHMEEGE